MKNSDFIYDQIQKKKSLLCVGLDPDITKIPSPYCNSVNPQYDFCKDIIEITHQYAIAYKINVAFFESQGPSGWEQLEKLIALIPQESFIIADAKRADIGNTSQEYAKYYFEKLNVDAITLHPYMGIDSLEPFLKYKNKWSIILSLTSNQGSRDIELKRLESGELLYEKVMKLFLESAYSENVMFVCGATHPEEFINIRKICPDHFLLVPGVGTQGGELKSIITNGINSKGGLFINVSRKISFPESGTDFKTAVTRATREYQQQMGEYL